MTSEIAIGTRDGQVVLQFHESVQWVALDPQNALMIGEAIAKAAYECKFGKVPDGTKSVIKQEVANRLYTRVEHVLRSLLDREKSNKYIAHQVVDTVLAEVA